MKCPECGFINNAGSEECEKCGCALATAASGESSRLLASFNPNGANPLIPFSPELPPGMKGKSLQAEPEFPMQQSRPPEAAPQAAPSFDEDLSKARRSRVGEQARDWRLELSDRVENYRKRRGRAQSDPDPRGNFELDFDAPEKPEPYRVIENELGASENTDGGLDIDFAETGEVRGGNGPLVEVHAAEESSAAPVELDTDPLETEMSLGEPVEKNPPVEILVDSPIERAPEEEAAGEIYLAPLGRRFLAGLTDTLVLMLGAAVFGMIFWQFCGRVSLVPINLAVFGLVAVFLIFAYFGVCTAVASATPGLLWMGCEIRNLSGDYPTPSESFWRAFGVLVSGSALMLGFIWASVDTDKLTWHDRMSGTVITVGHPASDLADVAAQS